MNKSRRLRLSWTCLVSGFFSLLLDIGPVLFVVLLLAHCCFRYSVKPRLLCSSFLPPWCILTYLLLTSSLVLFPAAHTMHMDPSFTPVFQRSFMPVFQRSFGPIFRMFQWLGASFLLL